MTNAELRFMEVVPNQLGNIAKALNTISDKLNAAVAPKLYAVTYVGLSTSEDDANGYSNVAVFDTMEKAKAKFAAWKDAEIDNLVAEERPYDVLENTDTELRIAWSGSEEQIRLEIHEIELNK